MTRISECWQMLRSEIRSNHYRGLDYMVFCLIAPLPLSEQTCKDLFTNPVKLVVYIINACS